MCCYAYILMYIILIILKKNRKFYYESKDEYGKMIQHNILNISYWLNDWMGFFGISMNKNIKSYININIMVELIIISSSLVLYQKNKSSLVGL